MGFMTEVSILNDAWDVIESNPDQLVQAIKKGMNEHASTTHAVRGSKGGIYISPPITVHPSHHADDEMLYVAYQNGFMALDYYSLESKYCRDRPVDYYSPDSKSEFQVEDSILNAVERNIEIAEHLLEGAKRWVEDHRREKC